MTSEHLFVAAEFGRVPLFDGESRLRLDQPVDAAIDTSSARTTVEVISLLRDQLGGDETQMCLAAAQALDATHEEYSEELGIPFGEFARISVHYAIIQSLCKGNCLPGLQISQFGDMMPDLDRARSSAIDLAIYAQQQADQRGPANLHPQRVGLVRQIVRDTDYQTRLFLGGETKTQSASDASHVLGLGSKIAQNCIDEFNADQKTLAARLQYDEAGYLAVENKVYFQQVKSVIFDRVEEILLSMKFNPKRIDVVRLYAHGTQLKDIGTKYGVSESRAFQIHQHAIMLLRQHFAQNGTVDLDLINN